MESPRKVEPARESEFFASSPILSAHPNSPRHVRTSPGICADFARIVGFSRRGSTMSASVERQLSPEVRATRRKDLAVPVPFRRSPCGLRRHSRNLPGRRCERHLRAPAWRSDFPVRPSAKSLISPGPVFGAHVNRAALQLEFHVPYDSYALGGVAVLRGAGFESHRIDRRKYDSELLAVRAVVRRA